MDSQEYEDLICPVLDMKICRHEDRYSIEVLVESLFQDGTASWIRIVSGIDKYVTESMQTKEEEHGASGRLVAKARPRLKPCEVWCPPLLDGLIRWESGPSGVSRGNVVANGWSGAVPSRA